MQAHFVLSSACSNFADGMERKRILSNKRGFFVLSPLLVFVVLYLVTSIVAGDFYNVLDTGNNYAWDGTEWDFVGNIIDFDPITTEEIDDITE